MVREGNPWYKPSSKGASESLTEPFESFKDLLTVCFDDVTVTAACIGPLIAAMVPMLLPWCVNRRVPSLRSSVSITSQRPSLNVKIGLALPAGRGAQEGSHRVRIPSEPLRRAL